MHYFVSIRAGKIRFSVTQKSALLKASSGEPCAPCDLRRYAYSPHHVTCCVPNEIDFGKISAETNSNAAASTRTTSLTWRH